MTKRARREGDMCSCLGDDNVVRGEKSSRCKGQSPAVLSSVGNEEACCNVLATLS